MKKTKKQDNHARAVAELENIVDLYARRCVELEALASLKDQRIQQLEKLLAPVNVINTPWTQIVPNQIPITIPGVWPICQHEWPTDWNSTVPPQCKKCGMSAPTFQPYYQVISQNVPNQQENQHNTVTPTQPGLPRGAYLVNNAARADIALDSITATSHLARH